MPKTAQARLKYLRGFTLIELLLVIVIIGILAVAGLVLFVNKPAQARDAVRKQDLAFISRLLEYYAAQNLAYPDPGVGFPKSTDGTPAWIPGLVPEYVQSLPRDPKQTSYSFLKLNDLLARFTDFMVSPVLADTYDCAIQKVPPNTLPPQNIGSNETWHGSMELYVTANRGNPSNFVDLLAYTPKVGPPQLFIGQDNAFFITVDTNSLYDGPASLECRIQTGSHISTTVFQRSYSLTVQNGPLPPPLPLTFSYGYQLSSDRQTYTLWGSLEDPNDPAIIGGPKSKCTQTGPPPGTGYNYCIEGKL